MKKLFLLLLKWKINLLKKIYNWIVMELDSPRESIDTAGHPVKKIDKWLTRDIDEAVIHDEQIKDTWICMICNESTYAVEYDYMGSGTNHLKCELEIE